jgi:hypothetical protein
MGELTNKAFKIHVLLRHRVSLPVTVAIFMRQKIPEADSTNDTKGEDAKM